MSKLIRDEDGIYLSSCVSCQFWSGRHDTSIHPDGECRKDPPKYRPDAISVHPRTRPFDRCSHWEIDNDLVVLLLRPVHYISLNHLRGLHPYRVDDLDLPDTDPVEFTVDVQVVRGGK